MELRNRAAFHEYHIETTYIAGMVLVGTEVKAIRNGKVSFNDSYCTFNKGELYVKSMHISEYAYGTTHRHEPTQERKLLLHKKELKKLESKIKEKGYTIVPLRIFFNEKNIAKIEIGLGKGKKVHDKRETIKTREVERDIKRYLK
ncbi:SsrA-binding protein SmpB [Flavihumibacter solisilvae]|uniref:SsrA-binding protein n=1 Tax=Flavihumibacter solisilvae TaxID=1349421 RepID=A0A0C1L2V0_9BACT|nr:SsrA-binding protein SmpB [Flavihumibacter solisilvae]KIC93906.1 single-stranded DNA-binding protein [Flavihumibacter solisilvae]